MKHLLHILGLSVWLCLAVTVLSEPAGAAPCTRADGTCTEWITVAGGPA
jgi:hypothetical protein